MENRRCLWPSRLAIAASVCLGLLAGATASHGQNWPRFRGPDGSGVSEATGIPATWSPGDYAWNIELPGEGHSSPVVWGDRLFVTSAIDEGAVRLLICLDAASGEEIWIRPTGMNQHHKHAKSSWASPTPATDGRYVYVSFADREKYFIAAYDFDGELKWRRSLGPYESQHGVGASPILYKGKVIVPNDQDGPSSVVAFDCETGRTVWSTLRQSRRVSYASPLIVQPEGTGPQLIVSCGAMGVTSVDPDTGRPNWQSGELPARTVASPVYAGGLIIQPCGGGGKGTFMVAVDPTHRGDTAQAQIEYTRERELPYVPTPVAYGDHLYLWNDNGVVSCTEARTGENVWTRRLPSGGNYSGSPICVGGKLYTISENGDVVVVAASPEFEYFGSTSLGDPSHSTPAAAHGRLYLRTFHRLACLEAKP